MEWKEKIVKVKEVSWKIYESNEGSNNVEYGIKYEEADGTVFFTDSYPYSRKEALQIRKIGSMRILYSAKGTKALKFKRAIEGIETNNDQSLSIIEINKKTMTMKQKVAWNQAFETIGRYEFDPQLLPILYEEILEDKKSSEQAWKNINKGHKIFSVSFLILILFLMLVVPIYAFIIDMPLLFILDFIALFIIVILYVSVMILHANFVIKKINKSPLICEKMGTVIGSIEGIGLGYIFNKTIEP